MSERLQFLAVAAIIAMVLAGSGWAWTQVPAGTLETIQLNLAGTPDRYGDGSQGLLLPFCHL